MVMTEADIFSLGLHEVRELFEKRSNLIRFFKESIGDYIDSARAAKRKKIAGGIYIKLAVVSTLKALPSVTGFKSCPQHLLTI